MKPGINSASQLRLKIRRATLLLLLVWPVLLMMSHGVARAQEVTSPAPKRVLLINETGPEFPHRAVFEKGFQSVLRSGYPGSAEFYSETLETYRFPSESHALLMRDYLRRKYAGMKFDVIAVWPEASLEFLLRYRDELFPGVPIVYISVKRPDPAELPRDVTGIWVGPKLTETLELALNLHPDTKQVFVIIGRLNNSGLLEGEVRAQLKDFENRVSLNYLIDLPLDEVLTRVKNLPEHSVIFYVRQIRGVGDKSITPFQGAALIAQSSNAPVYGIIDTWVGSGIVGGKVASMEWLGAELARLALRVANGTRPEDIPVQEAPTAPIFDWRQLRRFHLSEAQLPPGSQVRFKELTFWEQYKWYIVAVLSLCAVEAFLIAVLLIERRGRRRAITALDRLNVELEERVTDRTSALAAKTRELETFTYSVAHDLKAPLRGIDGYSRLLLEGYMDKLDEDGRAFLHTIRTSTNEMSQLIEDLLAYSRLEQQEMTSRRIELRPLIKSLVEKKRNELGERKVDFTVNVNGGTVIADVNGLAQALRNYLDNAIKFTSDDAESQIEIGTEETEKDCRVWVRDNGVGFDMKYHDKIFEMFTRLHNDEEYAGTGIGLAIVRKAVERMKGRVWAESSPGKGATFYLEIPKGGERSNDRASDENHEE